MKMIAALIPFALLTFGVLGCTQQASTSPTVERPVAQTSSNTNTFGESKEEAAGSAASARDASYGTDQAPAASSGTAAESTPPK